jgi:hypothetical protein
LTAAAFAVGGATFETARTLACLIFAALVGVAFVIGRWWLGRAGALALVVLLVVYRVWAYPHWHMLSYSSLAILLVLGATALVGVAFRRGTPGAYVVAGMVAALAMVTKQDSGVLGTAALAAAILLAAPEPARRWFGAVLYFVAGAATVFSVAVLAVVWAGMLPALVRHTIVAPLHGLARFRYQGSPALWPFLAQDPELRARAFSYFPSIVVDLYWPALAGSRLFRETALPDVALRLAYHGVWLVPLVALPLVVRTAPAADRDAVVRRARERLVVVVAIAAWLAFNRPHDWIHLLVLYPPALLVVSLVTGRAARGWARPIVQAAVALVLVVVVAISVRVVRDARRMMASPVVSTRGTVYATAPQAASLQSLVDGLAVAAPPDVPLASLPYHPLLNFIAARPPLTRYYSVWPAEPDDGRTATVEHDLDARPNGLVVYNQSQVPYFPRLPEYAPDLFAYLADNYRIAQVLGGQAFGYEFLLLRREPPPFGRALLGDGGASAHVVLEPDDGAPRDATPQERARLVGPTVWPFERVLRVGTVPGTTVAVRIPLTPGPTTRVFTSYGVNPETWTRLPPFRPRFRIAVVADGAETSVADATILPFGVMADRRWTEVTVDLAPFAGQPVELVLRVTSPPDVPAFDDRTGFGEPRVSP